MEKKYSKKLIVYNKLVRDQIPDIIKKQGLESHIRLAKKKDMPQLLKEKILEEAQELKKTKPKELKKEISDIFECLYSLMEELKISKREIETLRRKRARERGRFKKRIFLIKTTRKDS